MKVEQQLEIKYDKDDGLWLDFPTDTALPENAKRLSFERIVFTFSKV